METSSRKGSQTVENKKLRRDADRIVREAIREVMPDRAVVSALKDKDFGTGRVYVVSVGKAAWQMAKTAAAVLGSRVEAGICVTKYGHAKGEIPGISCYEAGHPVPDGNSFRATEAVLKLTEGLKREDTVVFLLSGGGSALFEKPLVPEKELADITDRLLAGGADIVEMNTVRKRLSGVKGGRFAEHCYPARVYSIILSDILGDPPDMIASGPTCPDSSTCSQALAVAEKYGLQLSEQAGELLERETPGNLSNVETAVTGSVKTLCRAAAESCRRLGYAPCILTDSLNCEAREAGRFLGAIARSHQDSTESLAFIAGGETVGSDGTDGPTDAAGGFCDGETMEYLNSLGVDIFHVLRENDSYEALRQAGGLIFTGPTGTNVNDVAVVLIRRTGNDS